MIDKVCKYLDITKEQILASRVTDESVIVVVDYGVSGGKKYTIAIADLEETQTSETVGGEPKPAETKKAATRKRSSKKASDE